MTRPRFIPPPPREPQIAIHVRGGDFSSPGSIDVLKSGRHNHRLPITWYIEMLTGLRKMLDVEMPGVVYSDCMDGELAQLLTLARVTRSPYREAITDMLAMSDARVLISSGSGFSRWGSYLGQVPRLCFPGQRTVRTLQASGAIDLEPECETAADIGAAFCQCIIQRASPEKPSKHENCDGILSVGTGKSTAPLVSRHDGVGCSVCGLGISHRGADLDIFGVRP